MNKKLIAMAVAAGLTAPMAAQAGVTVYGHLQVEIASVTNDGYGENNTGGDRTGIATNQSGIKMKDNKRGRLGFKVSEDLGGGLKGIAKFEWQIDTPNGNIADGAREGWVGLKGGWGEFKAGRVKTPYKYTGGVKYDPFVTTYLEARKSGGMLGGAYGQNSFWNQSVSYKNKWGGLSLWVLYGLDEGDAAGASAGSGGTMGSISAAVKYGAKNWEVFAAYNKADGDVNDAANGITTTGNDRKVTKLGGRIKFASAHTISAQYEMDDPYGSNNDGKIYFLGYQFKMGKNVLAAQYGNTDYDPGTTGADATYYALGWIYKFSEKTRAFVGYRNTDGKAANNDLSVISTGLRVDF
ncbi:MAG TPA: porin [Chromatiales bacterium]|nr:porin [Chromatiales bacterium]